MTMNTPGESAATPPRHGFHHVALVTPDLDATAAFYRDALGMRAGDVIYRSAQGAGPRHCFIKPGTGETWRLHFFERPGSRRANACASTTCG